MKFSDTTSMKKVFAMKKRIRAVCGGTSASKTISILVWLIDYSKTDRKKINQAERKEPEMITVKMPLPQGVFIYHVLSNQGN